MHGKIKNNPGPTVLSPFILPNLKIIARSYSLMILMHKIIENGKVKIIINMEKIVNNNPKHEAEALMRDGNQIKISILSNNFFKTNNVTSEKKSYRSENL